MRIPSVPTFARRFACLVTLGSLVACGGDDLCDRFADQAETCGEEVDDADMDTCKDALDSCDSDDRQILDAWADCMENGGFLACEGDTTGGESLDLEAMMACMAPLTDLSEECAESSGAEFGFESEGSTPS